MTVNMLYIFKIKGSNLFYKFAEMAHLSTSKASIKIEDYCIIFFLRYYCPKLLSLKKMFWPFVITFWPIVITFRPSSVIRPSTFHILIFSSETTGPITTKLWWNGPWMAPFQNCVRWSRLPTKMAAKLKIGKRGDEILIDQLLL